MALSSGTRLGLYEILAPLGAGGMGEVYRARDTKLKRDVAIKVLLSSLAADEGRLARLEREAQVLASLNHPHIAAIYGLEEEQGQPFLVLELVEGPTLAERMQQGPIPLEEALPIAKQMVEALSEAHEKGIIHRDLKPGNVKLTLDGRVKVLDFGLAKALAGDGAEGGASTDLSQSPTLSRQATAAGVILGTAAYMSPEQAKGKSVDRRTDVWAFGVVLYEMLTGKHLFHGDDVSETLAAVLRAEPDWNALPAETPLSIRRLLRRCLEKDRERRLDSMRAGWLDIDEAQQSVPEDIASESPRERRWTLALVGATLFALGALVAGFLLSPGTPEPRPVTRFSIALGSFLFNGFGRVIAISPDGQHVAYVGDRMLHLRAMDSDELELVPIAGTEEARAPFFSPDSQWVGFSVGRQLKKVSISGGAPLTLCEAEASPQAASWSADDTIVFSLSQRGVYRVSANGGTPALVVPNDVVGIGSSGPQLLPGGKALLLTVAQAESNQVAAYVFESGEMRVLLEEGNEARYVATGHLVYGLNESLLAVPFDLDRLEVTGGPVPLLDGISMHSGIGQYDVSETGSLAYIPAGAIADARTLVWVNRDGVARPITESRRAYDRPRLSPDGRRLVIQISSGLATDAWVMELDRSVLTRLTFGGGFRPIWTPDGSSVFYSAVTSPGIFDIFSAPADGSGSAEQLTERAYRIPDSFTPDGKTLVFRQQGGDGGRDIGVLSLEGDGVPEILLGSPYDELNGVVSPDGRWIAYTSDESGEPEVYVQSFPDLGNKRKVSVDGGAEPEWSTDGTELFFRNGNAMMVVAVSAGSDLELARPVKLFEGAYVTSPDQVSQSYDVASDGRFVMVRREERTESAQQRINIVLNWFEELKARVPTE